jgi:hypothetical protein
MQSCGFAEGGADLSSVASAKEDWKQKNYGTMENGGRTTEDGGPRTSVIGYLSSVICFVLFRG